MKRVRQVLPKAVVNDEALRAAKAQTILRSWAEIVGPELAKRSAPTKYVRGVVWVAVTGSAWAQEMRMRKEVFIGRLREQAGDPALFVDLRFGVRELPPSAAGPEKEEPERPIEEMSIREIARRRLAKMREKGSEGP